MASMERLLYPHVVYQECGWGIMQHDSAEMLKNFILKYSEDPNRDIHTSVKSMNAIYTQQKGTYIFRITPLARILHEEYMMKCNILFIHIGVILVILLTGTVLFQIFFGTPDSLPILIFIIAIIALHQVTSVLVYYNARRHAIRYARQIFDICQSLSCMEGCY